MQIKAEVKAVWRQLLYALGLVTQLGLTIAVCMGIGWWTGLKLDLKRGTGAYAYSLIGLLLGLAAGLAVAYQLLKYSFINGGMGDG